MEDFERLNDTVKAIETNVDEIGTKIADNANALVEDNITITNFLSKEKMYPFLFFKCFIYGFHYKYEVYLKKGQHFLSKLALQ